MEAALHTHNGGGAPPLLCPMVLSLLIIRGIRVPENGGVKDSETPGGGVFQPFIEASRAPVLRVKLVRAG